MDQFNRREKRLKNLMERLNNPKVEPEKVAPPSLAELAWNKQPWPDSIELGLLQLDSRSVRLRGVVLEAFARAWAEEFLFVDDPLLGSEIDAYFEIVFSERAASLTRFVIRKHLQGEAPVSLNELAEQIYKPEKTSFRMSANRLIKDLQDAMDFTRIWKIEVIERTVQGRTEIGGYKISAGQLLIDWEEHVWRPLRQEQLRQFHSKYGDLL